MGTGGRERINDVLVDKLIELVADGMSIYRACELCHVHDGLWRRWRANGERDTAEGKDTLYARLSTGIQEARVTSEHKKLKAITAAGMGVKLTERTTTTVTKPNGDVVVTVVTREKIDRQWTALAWMLERTYPAVYGRPQRVDSLVDNPAVGGVDETEGTRDEQIDVALAKLEVLANRRGSSDPGSGGNGNGSS